MGMTVKLLGFQEIYVKVGQVNIRNEKSITLDDDGNEIISSLDKMDVIVHVYSNVDKTNKLPNREHHLSYNADADDKNPINQAYAMIKTLYEIVSDPV